jgi:hypothetical protein
MLKKLSFKFKTYGTALSLSLLTACGPDQNILKFLISKDQEQKDITALLSKAELLYDTGKFEGALTLATKARSIDPFNEQAAVLAASIHFSLASLDPFALAGKLMEQGKNKSEEIRKDELAPLKSLLGLSGAELAALTVSGNRIVQNNGSVVEGAPESGIFKDLPVLIPKTAPEARASSSGTLYHLNTAIGILCPFIEDGAKIIGPGPADPRHAGSGCPRTPHALLHKGKSLFLWALAHLTEAIAFHSVILYATQDEQPNLIKRSSLLSDRSSLSISAYIKAVTDLAAVVDAVFPTSASAAEASMLTGMLNDLQATSQAFAGLAGIPESMTAVINKTMAGINEQKQKIAASKPSQPDNPNMPEAAGLDTGALKEKLTAELSENIRTQIETREAAGEFTPEQKADACEAYKTLSDIPMEICNSI